MIVLDKNKYLILSLLLILLVGSFIVFQKNQVKAANFLEDFTATTYKDVANTTGNWDTAGGYAALAGGASWTKMDGTAGYDRFDTEGNVQVLYNSMVLDNNGYPNLIWIDYVPASGDWHLYFSRWTGSAWKNMNNTATYDTLLVTNTFVAQLKLDDSNNPNIFFICDFVFDNGEMDSSNVCYTRWSPAGCSGSGCWTKMDGTSGYDQITSGNSDVDFINYDNFVLDNSNHPHLAWANFQNDLVRYVDWNGSSWNSITNVASGGSADDVMNISLANDIPIIAFIYAYPYNQQVYVTKLSGGAWKQMDGTCPGLPPCYDNISNNSAYNADDIQLRIDSNDNPVVAWGDNSINGTYALFLSRWNGSDWVKTDSVTSGYDNVSNSNDYVSGISMELSSTNDPYLTWWEEDVDNNVMGNYFSKWTPGGCGGGGCYSGMSGSCSGSPPCDDFFDVNGVIPKIALNSLNQPSIAWTNNADFKASYSKWNGSTWAGVSGIDTDGNPATFNYDAIFEDEIGAYPFIAFDNSENPIISAGAIWSFPDGVGLVTRGSTGGNYNSSSIIQSLDIYSGSDYVGAVTLIAGEIKPAGTSITYQVTGNGTGWCDATNGDPIDLTTCGTTDYSGIDLRWRATLTTSDSGVTPIINNIQLLTGLDINIMGTVDPMIKFDIVSYNDSYVDTSTCALGTLAVNTVASCQYRIGIGTNGTRGFTTYIQDTQVSAGQQGLRANSYSSQIADIDPADYLVDGDGGTIEEYGLRVDGTPPTGISAGANFAGNNDKPIPYSSADIILSAVTPIEYIKDSDAGDTTIIKHSVIIQQGTPAGYYTQTIRYTVTGNF